MYCSDVEDYNNLDCYKDGRIYSIYGTGPRGSSEINMSIVEYFYTGIPIVPELLKKIRAINDSFLRCHKNNPSIKVYHGTNFVLDKTFKTLAFFSTTTDMQVAKRYGNKVYEICIPHNFPYIHLEDITNKQILLPIGTELKSKGAFSLEARPIDEYSFLQAITRLTDNNIQQRDSIEIRNSARSLSYRQGFNTTVTKKRYSRPYNVGNSRLKGSSFIEKVYYEGLQNVTPRKSRKTYDANYVIKSVIKRADKLERTQTYAESRVMNEMLASKVYNFYGCKTLDFSLIQKEDKVRFYLGSKFLKIAPINPTNLDTALAKELLDGYLVDCIVSNWDVGNNNNIGIVFDPERRIIRSDIGGSLAYRGIGDFKLDFFRGTTPNEHVTLMTEPANRSRAVFLMCIDVLEKNGYTIENIVEWMFDVVDRTNIDALDEYVTDVTYIFEKDGLMLDLENKILQSVKKRHKHYADKTKRASIKAEISEAIQAARGMRGGSLRKARKAPKPDRFYDDTFVKPSTWSRILSLPKGRYRRSKQRRF